MTAFLRLILLVVLLLLVALLASVDPGRVVVEWFGLRLETTAVVALILLTLVVFMSMGLMRGLLVLASLPARYKQQRQAKALAKLEAAAQEPKSTAATALKPIPKRRGKK